MRITCDRCLRRYDVPDAAMSGRKIRARCKCGARIVIQDHVAEGDSPESADSKRRPTRWFVDITSWEPIAMDMRQLVRAFAAGRIDADTLIWCKGMPDWRRLREVDELAERLLGVAGGASPRASKSGRPGASEMASEPPPPRRADARRSVTPQASYIVASAGDTAPLRRLTEQELSGHALAAAGEAAEHFAGTRAAEKADTTSAPPVSFSDLAASPSEPPGLLAGVEAAAGEFAAVEAGAVEAAVATTAMVEAVANDTSPRVEPFGGTLTLAQHEENLEADIRAAERSDSRLDSSKPAPLVAAPLLATASEPAKSPSQPALPRANAGKADLQSAGAMPLPNRAARQRSSKQGRRRSSSEETPAQKPASMSVAPQPPRPHRGRRLVALAGTLGLVWLLGKAIMDRSTQALSQVPVAPESVLPTSPVRLPPIGEASSVPQGPGVKASEEAEAVAPSDKVAPEPAATAAAQDQAPKAELQPRPALPLPARVAPQPKPILSVPAPPKRAPAPAPQQAVSAVAQPALEAVRGAPANAGAAESPAAESSATASPATASPATESPATTVPASKAGPFDLGKAEQQMAIAAWVASTCGQMGETRGTGQVKVLIEPSGRVVRVTQLDPSFVGTPVGLCVSQAYQQVQVPPFEGGTRSLVGSFVVK